MSKALHATPRADQVRYPASECSKSLTTRRSGLEYANLCQHPHTHLCACLLFCSHWCAQSHKPGAEAKHFTLSHYEKMPAGPRPDTGGVTASALPALATPESFTDSIFSSLEATSGEVVLFIHGFDESWPNAIKKAAQLTWDTSQASPAAAAGGTPADGDNANGKRVALAFDWAPSGHSGPFTFTPYKGEKGINAAQDHLPHLLQILEKLVSTARVPVAGAVCVE